MKQNKTELKQYKENYSAVRKILNDWDVLKILPEAGDDQYEDLINPILTILPQEDSEHVLADIIHIKLTCDYGLPGSIQTEDVANELLKWWENKVGTK